MKVAFIVTGKTEYAALPAAFQRLFVEHKFECVRYKPPPGEEEFPGFTSSRLPVGPVSAGVRSNIDVIVQRAAAEVLRGREAPDLLVILDDLELANADQPSVIVECFRAAVEAHLNNLGHKLRRRTAAALRDRASLHFAAPMIESCLFADPEGPTRAGVRTQQRPPLLPCTPNFEGFETNDATYLDADCSACRQWAKLQERRRLTKNTRRAHQPEWCRGTAGDRCRHPKRYLAWLCRDVEAKKCSSYREFSAEPTHRTGATALRDLDWSALAAAQMPFLAALLDDL